ncbi:DUF4270 domain-containing protein [Cryomorpha ignava]|uniref:DUF4270 domain-containing protein n=1 Tax=Cryomorpha ignava TaxID=101383 RepID=A0A7K3WKI1_9FLAO|nr:DUF4270 family protein [Cryomorpha ignava]NEN22038.1 DUF4270 domain-containing protein [Cryomorpha ignava]
MNKKLKRPLLRAALFFITIALVATSCKKPEEEIGLELQPGSDLLQANMVDTFSINAYTVIDDSVRTDKLNPAIIGAFDDPVFGFTKAGHISELRLTSNNPSLIPEGSSIDNIVVDSVVLILEYINTDVQNQPISPVYGDMGEQYFEVFEITDSLQADTFYYENTPVNYIAQDLIKSGFNYQTPNTTDSVVVGDLILAPQMRIPLNESFADRFFQASDGGGLDNQTFVSLLKGIYITVDETKFNTSQSGLISFDTFTGNSRIRLYYRNELPDTTESYAYSFALRGQTPKYERIEHDYSMAAPSLLQQLSGDTLLGQQDVYVQSLAGTKIFLDLPYIESLRDSSGIAINQAKITLPIRGGDLEAFAPPTQLLIFPRNEEGKIYTLQFDNPFDYGKYNEEDGVYEFYITRYLQQVLLGEREHYGFEIVSIAAGNSPNRVVLNGAEYPNAASPSNNLKLAITFTKF